MSAGSTTCLSLTQSIILLSGISICVYNYFQPSQLTTTNFHPETKRIDLISILFVSNV